MAPYSVKLCTSRNLKLKLFQMKKSLILLAIIAATSAAYAEGFGNAALANSANGTVTSQSTAAAAVSGTGTAFSSTQSGSFVTFGQTGSFTNAPAGSIGGTANVAGFAQTSQYATSTSVTTGNGVAGSASYNVASANVSSIQSAIGNGVSGYTGDATGAANSYSSATVGTVAIGDMTNTVGNQSGNASGYSASDSAISSNSVVNGVPVTSWESQTSAMAFSNGSQSHNGVTFSNGTIENVGFGLNLGGSNGNAQANAN